MDRRYAPGLVLIIIGLLLLLTRQHLLRGDLTVLIIGTLLLVIYAFSGQYGLLIPGGILTGLGAGIALREWVGAEGASVVLGLGLGFLSIYAVDRARGIQRTGGWWPVIPGGILTAIGVLLAAQATGTLQIIGTWWPVVLVALGIWLLFRPRARANLPGR